MAEAFVALGVALGLGLLVGFQRERSDDHVAGFRTFPMITASGALAAIAAGRTGAPWLLPATLLAVTACVLLARSMRLQRAAPGGEPVGITTEIAAIVMFLVGVLAASSATGLAVVSGGAVAVLLHFKTLLHGLARRLSDDDVRVLMRIVLIGLVILPALPDRTYGPYGVLNPFEIWLMVVLIVGISVVGYVLYQLLGARTGTLLAGVLGGLISSTATTASYARRVREDPQFARLAAAVVMVASAVVFLRIFVEIAVVASEVLPHVAAPLGAAGGASALASWIGMRRAGAQSTRLPPQEDPTELPAALVFGALYGAILFAVAAAREHLGAAGIYGVATVSGLTDVDAITLSVANLVADGRVDPQAGWRAILLAALANLVFKGAIAGLIGGMPMLRALVPLFTPVVIVGAIILAAWP